MTSLILSARDVAALERVMHALLSPFDFETVDAWRLAVNRLTKDLVAADKATFRLPGSGLEFFTEDFGPEAFDGYPDRWGDKGFNVRRVRHNELRAVVWFRKTIHHLETLEERLRHYGTEYYSHCVAVRGFDSLGLTIDPLHDGKSAGLIFHHDRPKGPRFGSRGHQLLQLVVPAFRAGVKAYLRLAARRAQLGAALDLLSEGAVLCDSSGRPLQRNAALSQLLANDPEHARIQDALQTFAQQLGRTVTRGEPLSPTAPTGEVTTARARYRLRGTLFGEGVVERAPAILVTLERVRAEAPRADHLAARYGLTPSEAEVAVLLVQRRTNAEIARALGISPHTARHHTESVFLKTGGHSRILVADLLKRPPEPPKAAAKVLTL